MRCLTTSETVAWLEKDFGKENILLTKGVEGPGAIYYTELVQSTIVLPYFPVKEKLHFHPASTYHLEGCRGFLYEEIANAYIKETSFICGDVVFLAIKTPTNISYLRTVLSSINSLELFCDYQLSRLLNTKKARQYVIVMDKKWFYSTYRISLFMLLLRTMLYCASSPVTKNMHPLAYIEQLLVKAKNKTSLIHYEDRSDLKALISQKGLVYVLLTTESDAPLVFKGKAAWHSIGYGTLMKIINDETIKPTAAINHKEYIAKVKEAYINETWKTKVNSHIKEV